MLEEFPPTTDERRAMLAPAAGICLAHFGEMIWEELFPVLDRNDEFCDSGLSRGLARALRPEEAAICGFSHLYTMPHFFDFSTDCFHRVIPQRLGPVMEGRDRSPRDCESLTFVG